MEEHRIKYKTTDGTLKEQRFDDFNEFADAIQDAAMSFYETGMLPNMSVETRYGQLRRQETVTGNNQAIEFLGEENQSLGGETESV
jgi:hypothetical protein